MNIKHKQLLHTISIGATFLLLGNTLYAEELVSKIKKLTLITNGDINKTMLWEAPLLECSKDGRGLAQNILSINAMEKKASFNLKIPIPVATLGEHKVVGPKDSQSYKVGTISVSYNPNIWHYGKDSGGYQKYTSGTVTFSNIPTKEGQHLIGKLEAKASLKRFKNRSVTMSATFDIVASKHTFKKCP